MTCPSSYSSGAHPAGPRAGSSLCYPVCGAPLQSRTLAVRMWWQLIPVVMGDRQLILLLFPRYWIFRPAGSSLGHITWYASSGRYMGSIRIWIQCTSSVLRVGPQLDPVHRASPARRMGPMDQPHYQIQPQTDLMHWFQPMDWPHATGKSWLSTTVVQQDSGRARKRTQLANSQFCFHKERRLFS